MPSMAAIDQFRRAHLLNVFAADFFEDFAKQIELVQ